MKLATKEDRCTAALQMVMGKAATLNRCRGVDVYFCLQGNTGCACLTVEENKSQVYQRREFITSEDGLWGMYRDAGKMLQQKEGKP